MPTSFRPPPRRSGTRFLAMALVLAAAASAPLVGGRKPRPKARAGLAAGTAPDQPETKAAPAVRRINGRDLKPGADLRGADLFRADLRGCDLTGADLRGADCRGARFEGTLLTGADLRHARLFYAELAGAVGADLAGAMLHPFFALPAAERVGDLDFLRTRLPGEDAGGPPTALACSAGGTLAWHGSPSTPPRLITPTGTRMVFADELADTVTLAGDARNRLWVFARSTTHVLDMAGLDQAGRKGTVACKALGYRLAEPPVALVPDHAGGLWLTLPPKVVQLTLEDGQRVSYQAWQINGEVLAGGRPCVAFLAATGHLAVVEPGQARVMIHAAGEAHWSVLDLPKGSRPRRVMPGPGVGFTFLQSQPGTIGLLGLREDRCEFLRLPAAGVARDPWAAAMGPDGHLWYTDRGAGRIGRIAPDRTLEEFQLPAGLRPLELVAGPDGRMYFTLEGRHRIGAIVAVPRVEAKRTDLPAGLAAEPAPVRRPDRRKPLTRAERHARLQERLDRAEARYLARTEAEPDGGSTTERKPVPTAMTDPATAGPGPDPQAGGRGTTPTIDGAAATGTGRGLEAEAACAEPAGAVPGVETKPIPEGSARTASGQDTDVLPADEAPSGVEAGPAAEARPTPLERLAALGVNLAPGAARHILARHGQGRDTGRSQFHARFSHREGLEALLADGLEACGTLGRVRCSDWAGRCLTLCRREGAGWRLRQGRREATSQFVVVTARCAGVEGEEHDIITAYPVGEDW